jgi:hypothetical protein
MQTTATLSATITHRTPKAKDSHRRTHSHDVAITFKVANPMNLKTGLTVPVQQLAEDCIEVARAAGTDLNAILGIHPTFESYALYLKEHLLAKYPTVEVAISDEIFSVSTE